MADKIITRYFKRGGVRQQINGEPSFIEKQIPALLADGWIEVVDLTLTPDEIKADMWIKIKAERDRRKLTGGYQAAGKWFHSDAFSRSQQLGLVALDTNMPAGIQWKTMDGSFVGMTPTLAQQILSAAAGNDIAIFTAAENHKVAMEASANPSSYDFSTGWPAMYQPA